MVGWIKRFFCPHDWEVVVNRQVELGPEKSEKNFAWILVQRCKRCGKVQRNIIRVK